MTQKILIGLVVGLILANASVEAAQQPPKIPRIGFLISGNTPTSTSLGPNIEAFRQGLRDLGYIEGKNIVIEYRGAGGKTERMPELIAELIGLGVDVIVTSGMPTVIAAKKATSTVPIVAANADNLVDAGVVASLAHPGAKHETLGK